MKQTLKSGVHTNIHGKVDTYLAAVVASGQLQYQTNGHILVFFYKIDKVSPYLKSCDTSNIFHCIIQHNFMFTGIEGLFSKLGEELSTHVLLSMTFNPNQPLLRITWLVVTNVVATATATA